MKKYKEYMDTIKVSDALHQRLAGLEEPGKRPIPWKKYGAMAAALALTAGLSAWGLSSSGGWEQLAAHFQRDPQAALGPEAEMEKAQPDIAIVDPNEVDELVEKTLGGYDVTYGSGSEAVVTHYILPYIEYGKDVTTSEFAVDWGLPNGAAQRDLTSEEILVLMGGEDAVATHLDWDAYELTGWAAWYENGEFWGAYLQGCAGPLDHFEFVVTANQLPPACTVLPGSVTQEVRGLTITADGHDGKDGCSRRVSFMKDHYGYRFDLTSTDTEQAERLVSRLVCRIADEGLDAVDTHAEMRSSTCDVCGEEIVPGTKHFHSLTGADEVICPGCGQAVTDHDRAHVHSIDGGNGSGSTAPYDPGEAADPQYHAPAVSAAPEDYICTLPVADPADYMNEPPALKVLCGGGSLESRSGSYTWSSDLGNGQRSDVIACGAHPLQWLETPGLTTSAGTAKLSLAGMPGGVQAVCWPDSELDNASAVSQELSVARNSQTMDYEIELNQGGWIYEVTAEWADLGRASYVFYIVKN